MISEWIGSDRVGSVIEGRFHLQRWLGGAGESGVFLTQTGGGTPRNAAIKIIPAGIADAESLLDQWIQSKRRIHPHLIQLFHAGYCRMDDCDLLYTITDRADEILADVLPVRPLTTAEVRELLDPLLETLTWLHGQGLVHGSLKPSNVMVVNEQVRLSVDHIQPSGPRIYPVLSPGIYEAPESAIKVTPAADIWSLGVLLVEALTQKPPLWLGTGPRIPASVPQPFATIASECLRLDPARRCILRDIRSYMVSAARAVAPPAAPPRAPAAEEARTPVAVARPAPISEVSIPAERSHVAPAPIAPAHVAPARAPANLSSNSSLSPSPSSIPGLDLPPFAAEPASLRVPSKTAAALEPALPVVVPAIAQTPPAVESQPAAIAPTAETAKPDVTSAITESLPGLTAAEVAAEAAPANPEPAFEQSAKAPEQSAIKTEQPALAAGDENRSEASTQDASGQSPAGAAQRRANVPAATPIQIAPKPRTNRLATVIASAMVVIAASLMLLIALHVSRRSSSTVAPSSATSPPSTPNRRAPVPQAPVSPALIPPASGASASSAPSSVKSIPHLPASAPLPAGPGIPTGTITPGAVAQRVLPHVTQRALDTIGGRLVVIVRVQVDANGNVTDAGYDYEGSSHYLKTAALAAARNWKFQPARIGGRAVPSTWDLRFWFDQSGPSVVPIEKAP